MIIRSILERTYRTMLDRLSFNRTTHRYISILFLRFGLINLDRFIFRSMPFRIIRRRFRITLGDLLNRVLIYNGRPTFRRYL